MSKGKVLAVDFDGVTSDYEGWLGKGRFAPPVDGVSLYLSRLKSEGWTIIIHTCRSELKDVRRYLVEHSIPFDHLNYNPDNKKFGLSPKKPQADVYLDDRGICFDGDWARAYELIVGFIPWRKRNIK